MYKYLSSASTACGDTTKTLIDTITLPASAKAIIGVWTYSMGGPGQTTLETQSGILELESPDCRIQPCQIPLPAMNTLTNGVAVVEHKVWPMTLPVGGNARISGYITMDMAITVANKGRFGLVVDCTD